MWEFTYISVNNAQKMHWIIYCSCCVVILCCSGQKCWSRTSSYQCWSCCWVFWSSSTCCNSLVFDIDIGFDTFISFKLLFYSYVLLAIIEISCFVWLCSLYDLDLIGWHVNVVSFWRFGLLLFCSATLPSASFLLSYVSFLIVIIWTWTWTSLIQKYKYRL